MSTFTPPVLSEVTPRFGWDAERRPVPTTWQQKALYKYMRNLDRAVNVYILSDDTVQTDFPVLLSNAAYSTTNVPYPILSLGGFTPGRTVGAPEGAEGGPYGPPPPYASVQDNITGQFTTYVLTPYLKYYFLGAHGPYPNLSANLVALLTAAHFDNYLS